MLAAGSEFGNVHVWEVWRREDEEDARAHEEGQRCALEAAAARGTPLRPLRLPGVAETDVYGGAYGERRNTRVSWLLFNGDAVGGEGLGGVGLGGPSGGGGGSYSAGAEAEVEVDAVSGLAVSGTALGQRARRPHFARKVESWTATHDFVQARERDAHETARSVTRARLPCSRTRARCGVHARGAAGDLLVHCWASSWSS
eukprot:6194404-Pleurochrysis_carterae.AAC.7